MAYQKPPPIGKDFQLDPPYFKPGLPMGPLPLDQHQFPKPPQKSQPNHTGMPDPALINYPLPVYRNQGPDYNPWKDNQPPQPPVSWWGTSEKDKPERDAFQSWVNPPAATMPIPISSDNYYQKSGESHEMKRSNPPNTYSLFSGNSWGTPQGSNVSLDQPKPRMAQQSLWSGPGPSPLERLLEQQKSLREGGT